jgi:hypothetical protein
LGSKQEQLKRLFRRDFAMQNQLIKTTLCILADGSDREIQEWTLGYDLVQTQYNGGPTWFRQGGYNLTEKYYDGAEVIKKGLRFRIPLSELYFHTFQEATDFYRYSMKNPIVESVEIQNQT